VLDSCPGFEFLSVNIMAYSSKNMRVSDEVVLCELLHESECSGDSAM
jgi:hypothetical protein